MEEKAIEFIVEYLKQKGRLSDRESDIVNTWRVFAAERFNAEAAKQQIMTNNAKYPEVRAAIQALPTTVTKPFSEVTEVDLKYNLYHQLQQLAMQEGLMGRH